MKRLPLAYLRTIFGYLVLTAAIAGCGTLGSSTEIIIEEPELVAVLEDDSDGADDADDADAADKRIRDVVGADAETDEGLFTVYRGRRDSYYYEIPDSLLGREMLLVSRIARTARNIGYGGQQLTNQVVRWDKVNDRIMLRTVSFEDVASDTLPIYQAVRSSNLEPIIRSFSVETMGQDSASYLINVTDLYRTDIPVLGLDQARRTSYQVRRLDPERTYIQHIRSFPMNVEARSVLTYEAGRPPSNVRTGTITLEINHSMLLLPEEPMQTRMHDQRVGYFSVQQTDYGLDEQRAATRRYITRWRLEPSDPEAYARGELVEPVEPIVFHIDPATPKQWRPWLKKGVEDWQAAFEEAGFKNAIQAREAPVDDPNFSVEDARYSMIRYYASTVQNAYGPRVHDPRSGEIITSSIGWYHNVMNLLRNWYFLQTAAANPDVRRVQFDENVMGKLVRYVAAHEVGHTLGLPHNWGSSHAIPVDSLRSPTYTAGNSTAASIMDYARFNYVAQPGDGVENFIPTIGTYDKWAIKWGYSYLPRDNPGSQQWVLNDWIRERTDDPRYFYGRQTGDPIDPRSQREALGDDNIYASELGVANLQRIIPNLVEWTHREGEDFSDLEEIYRQIVLQWNHYMGHVGRNIGGVYETHRTYGEEGYIYEFVSREKQERAVEFLHEHAFATPDWILDEEILRRTEHAGAIERVRAMQERVLALVTDPRRLARLVEAEARNEQDAYTVLELMDDLRAGIFAELAAGRAVDAYRRNLQRAYVGRMETLMEDDVVNVPLQSSTLMMRTFVTMDRSDIRPVVREQLALLKTEVERSIRRIQDRITRLHLQDLAARIDDILDG